MPKSVVLAGYANRRCLGLDAMAREVLKLAKYKLAYLPDSC
jgi:hypothetical protein